MQVQRIMAENSIEEVSGGESSTDEEERGNDEINEEAGGNSGIVNDEAVGEDVDKEDDQLVSLASKIVWPGTNLFFFNSQLMTSFSTWRRY